MRTGRSQCPCSPGSLLESRCRHPSCCNVAKLLHLLPSCSCVLVCSWYSTAHSLASVVIVGSLASQMMVTAHVIAQVRVCDSLLVPRPRLPVTCIISCFRCRCRFTSGSLASLALYGSICVDRPACGHSSCTDSSTRSRNAATCLKPQAWCFYK